MNDPFESPKLLVEEARHDLQTLIDKQAEFFASRPLAPFRRPDRKTGRIIYGLRPTAKIPGRIRAKANSVVGQLRNALDQATYSATVELCGPIKSTATYFPFCQSPDDFAVVVKKRCVAIPADLHPYLLSLEPYPQSELHTGGNDLFRALGAVAGPAKHQVALSLEMDTARTDVTNVTAIRGGVTFGPRWDSVLKEFHILETEGEATFHVTPWLYIRFDEPGAIGRAPASAILRDLCSMVERVILGIEAETIRLKG